MPRPLTLALHGLRQLNHPQQDAVVIRIREGLGALARAAGRTLLITRHPLNASAAELNLYFELGALPEEGCHFTILGDDASGYIGIRAHWGLRVCGPTDPLTGTRDVRRILTTDRLLGRALGNTGVHELGHFISNEQHVTAATNYMSTSGPSTRQRTMESQRIFWVGPKSWTSEQTRRLVECLRTGDYLGDMVVH
jgi:hypothetical protein